MSFPAKQGLLKQMDSTIRSIVRMFRRIRAIVLWAGKSLGSASLRTQTQTRLLMIYDFGSQPFSIGDVLVFLAASEAIRHKQQLSKVDFAFVFEADSPVIDDPAFSHINSENFRGRLADITTISSMLPAIGSTLIFDSHAALENFVESNQEGYFVWPDIFKYASREYLYYYIFNELLFDLYENSGYFPELQITAPLKLWAEEFVLRHAKNQTPVSVQLRRNAKDPRRNSNYDEWLAFFEEAHLRHGVKFILIGDGSESDPRFNQCPGLVIAKNFGTSLVQDLALITVCRFHIGASSGPSVMSVFSKKPYCLFNTDVRGDLLKGSIMEGKRSRLFFASPIQSMVAGNETRQILMGEFERIQSALKVADK